MKTIIIVVSILLVIAVWLGYEQKVHNQFLGLRANTYYDEYHRLLKESDELRNNVGDYQKLRDDNQQQNGEIELLRKRVVEFSDLQKKNQDEVKILHNELNKKEGAYKEQLHRTEEALRKAQDALEKGPEIVPVKHSKVKKKVAKHVVTVTAYTLSKDECSPSLKPALQGSQSIIGGTASVSRDLSYLLGTSIYIEGFGTRFINDLTSEKYTNRIDILVASKSEAFGIGCKNGVVIRPLG